MIRQDLTIGPVLFHWSAERKRDFWFQVADEAPVDVAYIGEVVCSKRTPFFDRHLEEVASRLASGGKKVIWSTIAEVVSRLDRNVVGSVCSLDDAEIEVNDASALGSLSGRPHRIGQYMNVYNEGTVRHLARNGARHFCLPAELPLATIRELSSAAQLCGASTEVQVFGKVSLALSARCYHARANGRTKDNCLFVCENDPDGMALETHSGKPFLSINGIQTLSDRYLDLSGEIPDLHEAGVSALRLSPHSFDMIEIASAYRRLLDGKIEAGELSEMLERIGVPRPLMNGFIHGQPGYERVANMPVH